MLLFDSIVGWCVKDTKRAISGIKPKKKGGSGVRDSCGREKTYPGASARLDRLLQDQQLWRGNQKVPSVQACGLRCIEVRSGPVVLMEKRGDRRGNSRHVFPYPFCIAIVVYLPTTKDRCGSIKAESTQGCERQEIGSKRGCASFSTQPEALWRPSRCMKRHWPSGPLRLRGEQQATSEESVQ